jgi:hypothetical protein
MLTQFGVVCAPGLCCRSCPDAECVNMTAPLAWEDNETMCNSHRYNKTSSTPPLPCPYTMDHASGLCWVEPVVSTTYVNRYTCPPGSSTFIAGGNVCYGERSWSCAHLRDTVYVHTNVCRAYYRPAPIVSRRCPIRYNLVGESLCRHDYNASGERVLKANAAAYAVCQRVDHVAMQLMTAQDVLQHWLCRDA